MMKLRWFKSRLLEFILQFFLRTILVWIFCFRLFQFLSTSNRRMLLSSIKTTFPFTFFHFPFNSFLFPFAHSIRFSSLSLIPSFFYPFSSPAPSFLLLFSPLTPFFFPFPSPFFLLPIPLSLLSPSLSHLPSFFFPFRPFFCPFPLSLLSSSLPPSLLFSTFPFNFFLLLFPFPSLLYFSP